MRRAVSAVVRTTSAERVAAGGGAAPSAARIRSFSAGRRTVIRNAVCPAADDEALRLQLVGAVGARGRRRSSRPTAGTSKPAREQRLPHPLALGDRLLDVELRVAERGGGDPRGRGRDGRRVAPPVELAGDLGRGDRVADPKRGEAERLRQRPDARRGSASPATSGATVFPPYSKYASSTTTAASGYDRASAAISSGSTSSPGRVVRVAEPDEVGLGRIVGELGPFDPRGDRVHRVRRLLDEGAAAGAEEGPRGERDQPVGAGAGDDLLGLDAGVGGGGLAQLPVGAVGVLVQPGEALAERHLRHAGQRRDVLVEADDLGRVQAVPRGDLVERRGPGVRLEPVRQRPGADAFGVTTSPRTKADSFAVAFVLGFVFHARTATDSACSGSPSRAASASTVARAAASPSGVARTNCTGLRNASSPSPPAPRASPPVGRTWFAAGRVVAEDGGRAEEHRSRRWRRARRPPPGRRRAARGARGRSRSRERERVRRASRNQLDPHTVAARLRRPPRRAPRSSSRGPTRRPGPCSACASRSAAHRRGSAVSSAITSTSLGPAGRSIATRLGDEQLRRRHPPVPRPDDLGDGRDRLGAVGERGDRLGAADRVELVDPELLRSREHRPDGPRRRRPRSARTPATRAGTAVITSDEASPAAARRSRPSRCGRNRRSTDDARERRHVVSRGRCAAWTARLPRPARSTAVERVSSSSPSSTSGPGRSAVAAAARTSRARLRRRARGRRRRSPRRRRAGSPLTEPASRPG